MKKLIIIILTSIIFFEVHAQKSISEHSYEVKALTKNGLFCNFHFKYSISDQLYNVKRDQIHIRLDDELLKIANQSTLIDLVNIIDSIGPSIEKKIKKHYPLENLKVKEIRIDKNLKDYLIRKGINLNRVEIITRNDINNYAGSTKYRLEVKSHSDELLLGLKTKEGSEVQIKYTIAFSDTLKNPFDSLSSTIENTITDSLSKYKMYEMWTTRRDSICTIMENIIKQSYPETYSVLVTDVVLPENAKKHFIETEKLEHDFFNALLELTEKKILLTNKLEKNKSLSEQEINEIQKEIKSLENKEATILKKIELLNYDYKP